MPQARGASAARDSSAFALDTFLQDVRTEGLPELIARWSVKQGPILPCVR